MSEINTGDKVKAKGIVGECDKTRAILEVSGIVKGFEGVNDQIVVIQSHYGKLHYMHRWQCRKLVKYKKCDECKGYGVRLSPPVNCSKCNGSGKVKV
jgi:hypothetical protein